MSAPLTTLLLACLPLLPAAAPFPSSTGSPEGGDPPAQMPWQRTLEDALALSRETQKPLLICVNMDGEMASESLARGRYRDPAFVELVQGFIPVLASPSRHGERDHDARGRRISDPRFGRLVESEHIAIEPTLYRRYFNGRRVAPRHVGVAPDGTVLFDLFLLGDLGAINRALKTHGNFETPAIDPLSLGENELVASPDGGARDRLEELFLGGDVAVRERIAGQALSATRETQHPQIVRLAFADDAASVRLSAARAVARHPEPAAEFLASALHATHDHPDVRAELVAATQRLAQEAALPDLRQRAARLGSVFSGLARDSSLLAMERWKQAFAASRDVAGGSPEVETRLPEGSASVEASDEPQRGTEPLELELMSLERELSVSPDAPELNARFAYRALELAKVWIQRGGGNPGFMLEDVCAAATRALDAAGRDPLASACLARARYLLGDIEGGLSAVEEALPALDPLAPSALALDALDVLIQGRLRAVYDALGRGESVRAEWVADARAGFELAIEHPEGGLEPMLSYLGFLGAIEAWALQRSTVFEGLARYPDSAGLHGYLRSCVLRDEGAEALVEAYQRLTSPAHLRASFEWFTGLALFEAAEAVARDARIPEALELYRDCIARFTTSTEQEPSFEATSSYYIGLAHAGLARRHVDSGDLDRALVEILVATRHPISFRAPDGFDRTPLQTAHVIERLLKNEGREEELEDLRQRLDALTPEVDLAAGPGASSGSLPR